MLALASLGGFVVGVLGFAWWARRRTKLVDTYYDEEASEQQAKSVTDLPAWFNGGRL